MKKTESAEKGTGVFFGLMAAVGGIIGIWAFATMMTGLASVNWQPTEMIRQFLVATGNLGEYETLVDFYTHIKGVEYLIAVAFFVAFPAYYKYLSPKEATASAK